MKVKYFKVILKDKKNNGSIHWTISHKCQAGETLQEIKNGIREALKNQPIARCYNIGRITELK